MFPPKVSVREESCESSIRHLRDRPENHRKVVRARQDRWRIRLDRPGLGLRTLGSPEPLTTGKISLVTSDVIVFALTHRTASVDVLGAARQRAWQQLS